MGLSTKAAERSGGGLHLDDLPTDREVVGKAMVVGDEDQIDGSVVVQSLRGYAQEGGQSDDRQVLTSADLQRFQGEIGFEEALHGAEEGLFGNDHGWGATLPVRFACACHPTILAHRYPVLCHMAEAGTWPSIAANGLLSTTALLDLFEANGSARDIHDWRRLLESVIATLTPPVFGLLA